MTSIEQIVTLATFGAVWVVLSVGHNLAGYVIGQTDHQTEGKAAPSAAEVADGVSPRRGWGTCLGHVAQCRLVVAMVLALVWTVLPLQMSFTGLAAGVSVRVKVHSPVRGYVLVLVPLRGPASWPGLLRAVAEGPRSL